MNPITSDEMRKIEQEAITSGRVTGLELMERAGRGVVEAIFETWPALEMSNRGTSPPDPPEFSGQSESKRAVVLCGPGNNGGDGFVVARLLAERGWEVDVFFYGAPSKLPPDARENHDRWCEMGCIQVLSDDTFDGYVDEHPGALLFVDALFGIGLSRPFVALDRVQHEMNYVQAKGGTASAPFVVCVDIPSGLSSETGRYLGYERENPFDTCLVANLTVTFHRPKFGHGLCDGPEACGKLVVKDIGL